MSDDYELDDEVCPRCGQCPTHSRDCPECGGEGYRDDLHEEDPLWYDPGETETCRECAGTGIQRWCPKCGYDLQRGGTV